MNISYDPKKIPDPSPEMLLEASENGQQLTYVICEDSETPISFWSIYKTPPRIGESICTQDWITCIVGNVIHDVVKSDGVIESIVRIYCKPAQDP